MAMRSPIPKKMRNELSQDPFMSQCCLMFAFDHAGRIEWQHAMTYGGKRVNELYTILPLCSKHHKEQAKYRKEQEKCIRARINFFGLMDEFKKKYPKSDLFART